MKITKYLALAVTLFVSMGLSTTSSASPPAQPATVSTSRGVVICSTANPDAYNSQGIYHGFDYPFYFFNVRQNAFDRIQQYFAENP